MSECGWQFHGVGRRENGDGTVTLVLEGYNYTRAGACDLATEPCATRTVPEVWTEWDGKPVQLVESREAAAMAAEHCGAPYTAVFQGKGWTVEIRSDYPLWQTNG